MADKTLGEEEGRVLLALARQSIIHYMNKGTIIEIKPSDIKSEKLVQKGACFVSLFNKRTGELRGCIGSLEASRSLAFDVAANALAAAFADVRFYPLTPHEMNDIRIELSILTPQQKLSVTSPEDLLSKIEPRKHGLTIQSGVARGTFLPVVWEQIPDKEQFLANLCMKAGLAPDAWRDTKRLEFFIYETQEFSEE